jgi:hypothetical protein
MGQGFFSDQYKHPEWDCGDNCTTIWMGELCGLWITSGNRNVSESCCGFIVCCPVSSLESDASPRSPHSFHWEEVAGAKIVGWAHWVFS